MPRLWDATIETHRHAVREAVLKTTWALVVEHGLLSVTMSRIAAETGIGRATLYKYFPDVESILLAHHQRHVAAHLQRLNGLRDQAGTPEEGLAAVLHEFARICHYRGRHGSDELAAIVHRGETMTEAHEQLRSLVEGLLRAAGRPAGVRDDVPPGVLADYCLHALGAAAGLASEVEVPALVGVVLDGLRPPLRR